MVAGIVKAENVLAAERILRDNRLIAEDITPEGGRAFSLFGLRRRVSLHDRAVFVGQLSTMISAGLPLTKAISVIAAESGNNFLKSIFYNINRDLEEGENFSDSLAKYPEVFDQLFVNVIRSGETTGNLELVLDRLATKIENDNRTNSKIISALIYPAFIVCAMIVVSWIMMVKIVPQIEQVFSESNASLPWATAALIVISHFLANFWWLVIILILLLIVFLRYYLLTESGRNFYAQIQLRFPGFRKVSSDIYMARFCRTIEMLFESGVPLIEAINTTGNAMSNSYYKKSLAKISREVQKGVAFSGEISKDSLFPPLVGQMLAVGEQTGKSSEVMDKLARYYEDEADAALKGVYSLIEPSAIVIVGIGVGILVFAVLVPIYQIAQLQ